MERTFTRSLKNADIKTDADMLVFIKSYYDTQRQSGMRALQDFVVSLIPTINATTLKELLKVLNVVVPSIAGDALTTDIYATIRRAIIAQYGADSPMHKKSLSIMQFDRQRWRDNRIQYNLKVAEANASPTIYQFDTIKKVLLRIHGSADYIDALIFLQLCCGARIGELIYYANFETVEDIHYIKQDKVLKSKIDRPVIKPILFITPIEFIKRFNILRKILINKNITDAITGTAINQIINHRIKKLFNTDISTHEMRKLYADIAFQVYAVNQKPTWYVSQILGHDINSIQISTSYLTVAVLNVDKQVVRNMNFPEIVDIKKKEREVPRNTTARDGKANERLLATVAALENNGIKITARLLGSYGYGMRTVLEYMRLQKLNDNYPPKETILSAETAIKFSRNGD